MERVNKIVKFLIKVFPYIPVKKGEQLFIIYNLELLLASTEERQQRCQNNYKFTCKCSKCVPSNRPNQSKTMGLDPIFRYIHQFYDRLAHISEEERLTLKKKCFEFMKKFGHLPQTEEMFFVSVNLSECLIGDYPDHRKNLF